MYALSQIVPVPGTNPCGNIGVIPDSALLTIETHGAKYHQFGNLAGY
jgi:hypothetical protein